MKMNNLRIGFDDERERAAVHVDFMAAGYTIIAGVWTKEELERFARLALLARLIPVVAWAYINEDMTPEEALSRVEKMVNGPLSLGG